MINLIRKLKGEDNDGKEFIIDFWARVKILVRESERNVINYG